MTIVFNEIDTTSPLPGNFAEIDLESGAIGRQDRIRKLYILASRLSAGTMSDNEVASEPCTSWSDAQDLWGAGSEGAWMYSTAIRTTGGTRVPIYPVALPDAAGTKAQGLFIASGTTTSAGYADCRIGDLVWRTTITNGSTPQNTTDAIKAEYDKIAAWLKPPVTTTSQIDGAGPDYEVQVEANNTGAHYNSLQIEVIKFTPATQTLAVDAATLGTEQAGVGAVTLTTALGNLAAVRTHYLAFADYITGSTTTGWTAIKNHIIAKSDGNSMLGGIVFFGDHDTLSNLTTDIAAVDSNDAERCCVAWHEASKSHAAQLSVSLAVQQASLVDPTRPINGVVHNAVMAHAPSSRPTDTSCETAINGGGTPLRTSLDDDVNVKTVRAVTMRTDLGIIDLGTIETLDEFRDRGVARCEARFQNYKIVENDDDEAAGAEYVTTPQGVLGEWVDIARTMQSEGKLQQVADLIDQAKAEYVTGGGVALQFPAKWVPGLHRIMTKIQAVWPGT